MSKEESNELVEKIARFVETHGCYWRFDLQEYILYEREPHPKEPLAAAIRGEFKL